MYQLQVLYRRHHQYQHHQVCPLRQGNQRLPSYVTVEFDLIYQALSFVRCRHLRQNQRDQVCPLYEGLKRFRLA